MDRSRSDRILEDWVLVARQARRPPLPRQAVIRTAIPGATLAGASLIAVALAVAILWLGRGPEGSVGTDPSPSPSATVSGPTPAPTPAPTIGPCRSADLAVAITLWEGATGHRIADVELRNDGTVDCTLATMNRPQLLDGRGAVLIDGDTPLNSEVLTVAPGDVLTTLVQASNYCGPEPQAPTTVAFVLPDGSRIVAEPPSPTDATVPPCMGEGSPATIEMHPWAQP